MQPERMPCSVLAVQRSLVRDAGGLVAETLGDTEMVLGTAQDLAS
jgi:hypothetical protein